MYLKIPTIETGWIEVLNLFRRSSPTRIPSRHGVSFDIPGLTVWLENPSDLTPPAEYIYPELIKDYRDRLFGDQRENSLLYQRLRNWQSSDQTQIDQLESVAQLLEVDENTRAAAFSLWQPSEDLGADFPVTPVGGAFRVIDRRLTLFLTVRSLDVWVGFVPEFLTYAQLTSDLALRLGFPRSSVCFHIWSAHIYELDYLTYLAEDS